LKGEVFILIIWSLFEFRKWVEWGFKGEILFLIVGLAFISWSW